MAHIHEKIDFVVDVFIVHKNKVLLRLHDKYKIWLAVGGHIELNEDPNQAAVREVKEEVGLDIKLLDGNRKYISIKEPHGHLIPPVALNRHHISTTHEHISLTYFAYSDNDDVIPENHDDEWKWLTKEELSSLDLLPDIKFFAGLALNTLGEK